MKHVRYEVEELEDKTELGVYQCVECRTEWYDVKDVMPYFVKLKNRLRELEGNNPILKGEIPAGTSRTRPP